jgi:hypothetical protein
MRAAFNILAGVVCVLWGGLSWLGINFAERVTAQHVPGFPNATQIFYYIGVPGAVTGILILSAVIFDSVFRSPMWLGILSIVALLALPLYLYPYGGGV